MARTSLCANAMRWCAFLSLLLLVACSDSSDEPYRPSYNKGCWNYCGSYPSSPPPAPAPDPPPVPEGCRSKRSDPSRTDVTAAELRTILPGRYRSCLGESDLEIRVDEATGELSADTGTLTIGACGASSCQVLWGGLGSLRVWRDPMALSFSSEGFVEDYVRIEEAQ